MVLYRGKGWWRNYCRSGIHSLDRQSLKVCADSVRTEVVAVVFNSDGSGDCWCRELGVGIRAKSHVSDIVKVVFSDQILLV